MSPLNLGTRDGVQPAQRDGLLHLDRLIGRHLEDEEDLIVPVILIDGQDGLG